MNAKWVFLSLIWSSLTGNCSPALVQPTNTALVASETPQSLANATATHTSFPPTVTATATLPSIPTMTPSPEATLTWVEKWSNTGIPQCCTLSDLTNDERALVSQAMDMTYARADGDSFDLKNGAYQYSCDLPGSMPCYAYALDPAMFGDLNADGTPDIAFMIEKWNGGTAIMYYLAAAISDPGSAARPVPVEYLEDRLKILGLSIVEGQIVLELIVHGPNDPDCCGSQPVTWRYAVKNDSLVRQP